MSEIKWATLGDVCEFRRGTFPQPYTDNRFYGNKDDMPFVQVVDVAENYLLHPQTKKTASALACQKALFVPKGSVIVTLQGTIGRVAITQYDCVMDRTLAVFTKIDESINKKYFAYILKETFVEKAKKARGSTIKTITKDEFKEFKIPIPSLKMQEQIVGILDNASEKFGEILLELDSEIVARNKQYSYALEKLLSDEYLNSHGGFSLSPLADVCEIKSGGTPTKNNHHFWIDEKSQEKGICWATLVDVKQMYLYDTQRKISQLGLEKSSAVLLPKNTVLFSSRASIGEVCIAKVSTATNQGFKNFICNENILNYKFLYYSLNFFADDIKNLASSSTFAEVSKSAIEKFKIKIPPLKTQEQIVEVLDALADSKSGLIELLESEKRARMKQLEYLKDKLLGFSDD